MLHFEEMMMSALYYTNDLSWIFIVLVDNKINLHSLQNRPEKLVKGSIFYQFLKLVQINLIFSDNDNVHILSIYVNLKTLGSTRNIYL
jgi:hypothetical protein